MNHRLVRTVLLMSLAAAAACRGNAPADEEQGSAGFVLPGEEAYVSPEDSAKAADDVQAHTDAVRDSVRRASGAAREDGADEDARPAPAPSAASVEARYEACMAQTNQADAAIRDRLVAACENIRAQPPGGVPSP